MAVNGATTFNDNIKPLFKETYADGITEIMPDHCILQKMAPFNKRPLSPGKKYIEPVRVMRPQGWTFANSGAGIYTKNPARAGKLEQAEITANNMHLVELLEKESVHRAAAEGKQAFKSATSLVVEGMGEAARNQAETNLLWGQRELTQTASAADVNGVTVLTCSSQEWGAGIWMGGENMPIEIYDSTGATLKASAVISAIDTDNLKLTLDRTVLALIAAGGGDYVWRAGTRTTNGTQEAAGLHKILTNTGVIFNIDASKYTLWQASQLDAAAGPLDFLKWLKISSKAMIKGLRGGAMGFCSVDAWNNLSNNEAAFRRYAPPKTKIEVGADAITFVGASGAMILKPHAMMKKGYAMLLNLNAMNGTPGGDFKRIGAVEWTFEDEGDGEMLHYLPDVAGYQLELYSNQALLVDPPGRSALVKNITDT